LSVVVKNEPGSLAVVAGIFGSHKANILNIRLDARDTAFHTNIVDLEVHDLPHLMRIIASLRAADAVVQAERI
jgi:GTP diphosphokinase / guanosine-3',5'-bis(diphosphate) 3'-diphosphatase